METDNNQVELTSDQLRELLLRGKNINHTTVIIDEEIELFNKYQEDLLDTKIIFDPISADHRNINNHNEWLFPDKYKKINVLEWLLAKCHTEEEINRVKHEYNLYSERNLIVLLQFFIYLVDYFRKNNFVWGVGRGSSVNSYCLYLIGIHRIDSLKYNLPIEDYLK